jgi:hypothetical protein
MTKVRDFLDNNAVALIASVIIIISNYAIVSNTILAVEKKVHDHELRIYAIEKINERQNAVIENEIQHINKKMSELILKLEKNDDSLKEIYLRGSR